MLNGARSKDRRSVYIDSVGAAAQRFGGELHDAFAGVEVELPAAVRRSGASRRSKDGRLSTTRRGDDWNDVRLSVVSGRPISFITQLYAPRYVRRPEAELADNQAAAPKVFQGRWEPARRNRRRWLPRSDAAGSPYDGGDVGVARPIADRKRCSKCARCRLVGRPYLRPGRRTRRGRPVRVQLLLAGHCEKRRVRDAAVSATEGRRAKAADLSQRASA